MLINIAVIGHENSGKSTLIGHLLCNLGAIDKNRFSQTAKKAEKQGRSSFKYAFLMDTLKEEQERGITIETATALFETSKYYFTALDVPGLRHYIKNAINGISKAQTAILVVDATTGGFEAGISEQGLTKEHALIAFTFVIKQLIIAVNKIDDNSVKFNKNRFDEIKSEITRILTKIGFMPDQYKFVPISSLNGDNMTEKSPNLSWWTGGTLLDALNSLDNPKLPLDKSFRFSVCDVYNIPGTGTVVGGIVQSGKLVPGQDIVFPLSKIKTKVKSIEMFHSRITEAIPYNIVGISIDVPLSNIFCNDVCGEPEREPPSECVNFTAQIFIFDHPGKIHAGYSPFLYCGTSHVPCKFEKLVQRIDWRHGKKVTENPEYIIKDDAAVVVIKPLKPIIVELFKNYPILGRIVIRDMQQTVAIGVIRSVEK